MRSFAVIVITLLGIVAVFFIARMRLPDMLANNLSKGLGVEVSIDSMGFRPRKISIHKLAIGNPSGYSLPKAFSAEKIDLHAPVTTYFSNDVVVDEIDVDDIYLGIEFDSTGGTSGNWSVIFRHYQKEAGLDKHDGKKVLIKKLICNNIRTELLFKSEGKIKKLPLIRQIVLTNISTEGGVPIDQLTSSVLGQMLKEVFIEQNLGNMLKGIIEQPGKVLDSFLKPFEGIFNMLPNEALEYINTA